jgi:hypothetical protein
MEGGDLERGEQGKVAFVHLNFGARTDGCTRARTLKDGHFMILFCTVLQPLFIIKQQLPLITHASLLKPFAFEKIKFTQEGRSRG